MLTVTDLRISYGMLQAVRGIGFEVRESEILAIFGNNGAGKSSTVHAIMGLVRAKGSILWQGRDIGRLQPFERRRLGIVTVPEGRHVFSRMTIQENLEVALLSSGLHRDRFASRFDAIWQMFPRLRERRNRSAGPLSGGEAQMLAVSRGLIGEPKLLLVDELSLGLAPFIVRDILGALRKLADETGLAVVIAEQKVEATMKIADICVVLERGALVHAGTPESLRNSDVLRRSYLGDGALAHDDAEPEGR